MTTHYNNALNPQTGTVPACGMKAGHATTDRTLVTCKRCRKVRGLDTTTKSRRTMR
jgi:hypothetical protein